MSFQSLPPAGGLCIDIKEAGVEDGVASTLSLGFCLGAIEGMIGWWKKLRNCPLFISFQLHYIPITVIDSINGNLTKMASSMTEDSQYLSREEMMRSHYLWPQKSQNCTISVNSEAIQTTMITSKLFQPLYLGCNWVLHYIVYGSWLSNFDISLDLSIILKHILKKLNYLQSLQSSTRTASYDLRP